MTLDAPPATARPSPRGSTRGCASSPTPAPAAPRLQEVGRPNPAAHLTPEQIEGLGHELDALRKEVMGQPRCP